MSDDEHRHMIRHDEFFSKPSSVASHHQRKSLALDEMGGGSHSPTHDVSNRKWMKQMKRRIREFVSSSGHGSSATGGELNNSSGNDASFGGYGGASFDLSASVGSNDFVVDFNTTTSTNTTTSLNRNFGVRLDKCEPSSISPVIFCLL